MAVSVSWSEGRIAGVLARQSFAGALCVLPNCTWTGDEIDLLVVTKALRIVDVEIKITRADLKADAQKQKWWDHPRWIRSQEPRPAPTRREWPRRVWKHYYAMPAALWKPELCDAIAPVSGVLLLTQVFDTLSVRCERRAKCNPQPRVLEPAEVIDIARLASLRMWDAYKRVDELRAELLDDPERETA